MKGRALAETPTKTIYLFPDTVFVFAFVVKDPTKNILIIVDTEEVF